MFDSKKLMEMMGQAYQIQEQLQGELKKKEFSGSAGGGMVEISINGYFDVNHVRVDPSLVAMQDISLLQDLLKAAFNDASKQARAAVGEKLKSITSHLGLSGMGSLLS